VENDEVQSTSGISMTPPLALEPELAVRGKKIPGLEGLRGVAIVMVILYHLGVSRFGGGYLGVDLFFVLSGFLITSLLIEEQAATERIALVSFWVRRAKRLLPALFLVVIGLLAVIDLHAWLNGPWSDPTLNPRSFRGDAFAAVFFVANWHRIQVDHLGFGVSSPRLLWHLWSLSIEEQFYLVWPLVTVAIMSLRHRYRRIAGVVVSATAALASVGLMAWFWRSSHFTLYTVVFNDPMRAYHGTDSRAFGLLSGATLAWLTAARPQPGRSWRRVLSIAAPLAFVIAMLMGMVRSEPSLFYYPKPWMFTGGFLLFSLLSTLVIADVRQLDPSPLGRLLGVRPLRYLGRISYGLFLIHMAIIALLQISPLRLSALATNILVFALSVVLADLSYRFIENPVRRSAWIDRNRWSIPVAFAVVVGLVLVGTSGPVIRL